MTSRSLKGKIGWLTVIVSLCAGCATRLPPAAKSSETDAPQQNPPLLEMVEATESPDTGRPILEKSAGFVVHIDPATGKVLTQPRAASPARPLEQPLFQTAPAGAPQALELPSPTPGGGIMVNLNGQFHTPLVATTDADGHIRLEHRPGKPLRPNAK